METKDLIDDLRSRINPVYAAQIGTESYERRLCAEALEAQADEIERMRNALNELGASVIAAGAVAHHGTPAKSILDDAYQAMKAHRDGLTPND